MIFSGCLAGKVARRFDVDCVDCPAGWSSVEKQANCTICEAGKYAEKKGESKCLACPSYQTSDPGSSR